MEKHDPKGPVEAYICEANSATPLTSDEQMKLFQELGAESNWNAAQENVARRLMESQLSLVVSIAKSHASSGVPISQLIEHGNLGLMEAVRSFAKAPMGDFAVRAASCIENAITEALRESQ